MEPTRETVLCDHVAEARGSFAALGRIFVEEASSMKDAPSSSRVLFLLVSIIGAISSLAAQGGPPRPAVPVEPIAAIIGAFRSHSIVALPDGHGNMQVHAFGLSLIREPTFATTANDIVVEFGNARYQELMDRFVGGDDVPEASLRQVWQNTTVALPTWDSPLTEEFLRSVRAVNASLPGERRLRVLLGDPPIDWDTVHNPQEYRQWLQRRDNYPADLIQREVLAKGRRALVVYGQMHFQRRDLLTNFESADLLVSRLESTGVTRVFSIWAGINADLEKLQSDVITWRNPSLTIVNGTVLGAADFTAYYPFDTPRLAIRDGTPAPAPRDQWRSLRMEEQVDAVLYLGPRSSMTAARMSPALCADADYMEMRVRRMALAGLPSSETDRLKQDCVNVAPK
jgi:hypothetical protein